jgi:hypothetical protein
MNKHYLTIPIEGKKVTGEPKEIQIDKIEFDEFNPRISMSRDSEVMGTGTEHISQKIIGYFLKAQASYNELKHAIKHAGGTTQPIWIYSLSKDKYKVIEGNTRLKIHRDLRGEEEDGDKYDKINCIVLPCKLDEEVKDYIRLMCHLRGHTDWDVYERAKYLYNLYNKEKYPLKDLEKITKLSASDILQDIEAYKIMENQFKEKYGEGEIVHKFSYFKEFVKNKKLRITMEGLNLNENNFCDWVGQKKIDRAMDVRKLNNVLKESQSRAMFFKKDLDRGLELLRNIVPEKSEKIYIMMSDLDRKIDKVELAEIEEIKSHKSKKRKVVLSLHNKLKSLLGEK